MGENDLGRSLVSPEVVALALREHVHVILAERDLVAIGLQAVQEVLVEAHARVLLLNLLLLGVCWLSVGGFLLGGGLGLLRLAAVTAAATSEQSADALMGDFRACTEGHTRRHGLHEATAHHASSLGLRGVSLGCGRGSRSCRRCR